MRRAQLFCGLALAAACWAGCVERRMTIVSDPPGAMAIVNGRMIGPTPADVPSDLFIYYGDYDITLLRDGFEPLKVRQPVPTPWYEWFPLDFISENLVPCNIKDQRTFAYQLVPPVIVPSEELVERASMQRGRGRLLGPPDLGPETPLGPQEPAPEVLPPPARLESPVPEP